MHRTGKHVLTHAAVYLVARGLPGILAFLSIALFSRLLDPADYGRYALVIATASLLSVLVFQWIRVSLVRYLPVYKDNTAVLKSTLATTTFILVVAIGLVAAILCLLPIARDWRPMIAAGWVLLALQAFFELCCEYSRASMHPRRYMAQQLARSSAILLVGAALVLHGAKWRGPVTGAAAGMALAIAWVWRSDWAGVRFTIDRATLARLCHYGIPVSLTIALTMVISSSDRFLLAYFRGEEAAGVYSVAVDFTAQTIILLMMVVNLAIFPMAVRAFEHQGVKAAQQQMSVNAALLMAIGVPCVVGLSILAPGICDCFLGKNFRSAASGIMPLVALGAFLSGLKAFHFDAAFQFAHRTIHQVWIVLFAAVLNVVLNLFAVPRLGINGAAGASVLAYVVSIALTAWLGRRHFLLPFPTGAALRVLLAGAVMAAMLYPLRGYRAPWAVIAETIAGAVVYVAILLAGNFLEFRQPFLVRLYKRRQGSPDAGNPGVLLECAVSEGVGSALVEAVN